MLAAILGQQKGPNSSPRQHLTTRCTTNASEVEQIRLTNFCLIRHIHLTSHQLTTSFSMSTAFCRENDSTNQEAENAFQESNPKAQIFFFLIFRNHFLKVLTYKELYLFTVQLDGFAN